MNYSLTIREEDYRSLRAELFSLDDIEGAAYVLCGRSTGKDEFRLLVRSVIPVSPEHYLERRRDFLSLTSAKLFAHC